MTQKDLFYFARGKDLYSLPELSRQTLAPTHPSIQWAPGRGEFFPTVKRPEREAGQCAPSIAKNGNEWNKAFTAPHGFTL